MKRDLKIHYGKLEELITQLLSYSRNVEEMQESLNTLANQLEPLTGEAFDKLKQLKIKCDEGLSAYKVQITRLESILSSYINAMYQYIHPINRGQITRVDRNDIWMNMTSLRNGSRYISDRQSGRLFGGRIYLSEPYVYGKKARYNSTIISGNNRSAETLESILTNLSSKLEGYVDELWDIYNKRIVPYENTDDEYARKMASFTSEYIDGFDILKELGNAIWDVTVEPVIALVGGAFNVVKGVFTLVGGVVYTLASGAVVLVSQTGIFATPAWATKAWQNGINTAGSILYDPDLIIEGMAQNYSDIADEKGGPYLTYYIGGEFLGSYLIAKGVDKVKGEIKDKLGIKPKPIKPKYTRWQDLTDDEVFKVARETGDLLDDASPATSLKLDEQRVLADLLRSGKKVETVPRSTSFGDKTPDFIVDNIPTELKSLNPKNGVPNTNTGMARIKRGFQQNASEIILDGRKAGYSASDAHSTIARAFGVYPNKILPGRVEIWTLDGIVTNVHPNGSIGTTILIPYTAKQLSDIDVPEEMETLEIAECEHLEEE